MRLSPWQLKADEWGAGRSPVPSQQAGNLSVLSPRPHRPGTKSRPLHLPQLSPAPLPPWPSLCQENPLKCNLTLPLPVQPPPWLPSAAGSRMTTPSPTPRVSAPTESLPPRLTPLPTPTHLHLQPEGAFENTHLSTRLAHSRAVRGSPLPSK